MPFQPVPTSRAQFNSTKAPLAVQPHVACCLRCCVPYNMRYVQPPQRKQKQPKLNITRCHDCRLASMHCWWPPGAPFLQAPFSSALGWAPQAAAAAAAGRMMLEITRRWSGERQGGDLFVATVTRAGGSSSGGCAVMLSGVSRPSARDRTPGPSGVFTCCTSANIGTTP